MLVLVTVQILSPVKRSLSSQPVKPLELRQRDGLEYRALSLVNLQFAPSLFCLISDLKLCIFVWCYKQISVNYLGDSLLYNLEI